MKVSIIGGGGLVGSCAGFALQCGGIVSGIDLIDVNGDLCRGQALDLLHGSSIAADQRIRAVGYEAIPESDLICITAGLRRKPDESRLDLINRNVELFLNILGQVKAAGPKKSSHRPGRLQPGRRADLSGHDPAWPALDPGDRPGDGARFGPVPQPDRRVAQAAADAGHGDDPRRARRQHGADLVGRAGGGPAAGEVPRLDLGHGRRPLRQDPRQRRRGHQAQRGGGVRRRPGDPRRRPRDRPRQRSGSCRSPRWSNGVYGMRDVCISVPTCWAGPGSRPSSRSSSGPRKSRPSSTRARCSGTIDTVFKTNPVAGKGATPARPTPAPEQRLGGEGDDGFERGERGFGQVAGDDLGPGGRRTWLSRSTASSPRSTPARRTCREFILADAKDADMAFGIGAPGQSPEATPARSGSRPWKNTASRSGRSSSKGSSTSC